MKAALRFLLGITLFFGVALAQGPTPPQPPKFYIAPNRVTPGLAFDIVARLQADKYEFCEYPFPKEGFKVFLDPAKATFGDDGTSITRVIFFACPSNQTSMNITFTCPKALAASDPKATGNVTVQLLPGPKLDGTLQVTTTADKKSTATLVLKSVASVNYITGVKCTFSGSSEEVSFEDITLNGQPGNWDSAKKECTVGNIIGDASVTLQAGVTGAAPEGTSAVTVTCTGTFGPLQCNYTALTEKVPSPPPLPPPPLKLATNPVAAGENTIITTTMASVPDRTLCTLTLPTEKFHLNTTNTSCVLAPNSKTEYKCNSTDLKRLPQLQVHVDSSATDASDSKDVSLACGDDKASAKFEVSSKATINSVGLKLLRVGTLGLNISLSIGNAGPSDLKLTCTMNYPGDLDKLPQVKTCSKSDEEWACPLTLTVPGKDADEKVQPFVSTYTLYLPKTDFFTVPRTFFVNCTNDGVTVSAEKRIGPKDEIEWVNKDEVVTKPSDSYFWTYTIVIINLFLIALVVFVGMWWRNRAIAKTLSEPRADRFTELELFSAPTTDGRLPLSKKD